MLRARHKPAKRLALSRGLQVRIHNCLRLFAVVDRKVQAAFMQAVSPHARWAGRSMQMSRDLDSYSNSGVLRLVLRSGYG